MDACEELVDVKMSLVFWKCSLCISRLASFKVCRVGGFFLTKQSLHHRITNDLILLCDFIFIVRLEPKCIFELWLSRVGGNAGASELSATMWEHVWRYSGNNINIMLEIQILYTFILLFFTKLANKNLVFCAGVGGCCDPPLLSESPFSWFFTCMIFSTFLKKF